MRALIAGGGIGGLARRQSRWIGSNPTAARREYRRMLTGDAPDCAILHWGLAKTAGDTVEGRSEWLNAIYYGPTSGATREEWDLISSIARE